MSSSKWLIMTASLFLVFHPEVSFPTRSASPASSPRDRLHVSNAGGTTIVEAMAASTRKLGGFRKLKDVGAELQNQTYRKYFSKNISVHMVTTLDGAAKVCAALKKSKLIGLDCEGVNLSRQTLPV
jgi:hypothetical protein